MFDLVGPEFFFFYFNKCQCRLLSIVNVLVFILCMYVHCDSIITRSSGSTWKNLRYNGLGYIHVSVVQIYQNLKRNLFIRFSHTQTNAPPTVIWYGTSVSVLSFISSYKVITHEIFINGVINRCMLSCNSFTLLHVRNSVLKIVTVQVQASPLPWQAEVNVL